MKLFRLCLFRNSAHSYVDYWSYNQFSLRTPLFRVLTALFTLLLSLQSAYAFFAAYQNPVLTPQPNRTESPHNAIPGWQIIAARKLSINRYVSGAGDDHHDDGKGRPSWFLRGDEPVPGLWEQEEPFRLEVERLEPVFHSQPPAEQREQEISPVEREIRIYRFQAALRELFMRSGYGNRRLAWEFSEHPGYQLNLDVQNAYDHDKIRQAPVRKTASKNAGSEACGSSPRKRPRLSATTAESGGAVHDETSGDEGGQPPDGFNPACLPARPRPHTVSKSIQVRGQEYQFTTTLTAANLDLFCGVCRDLISPERRVCNKCGGYLCEADVNRMIQEVSEHISCPYCRAGYGFSHENVTDSINGLLWRCGQLCGSEVLTTDLRKHIDHCRKLVFVCEHEGCRYEGNYQEVEEHERQCLFRLETCPHSGCHAERQHQLMPAHQVCCTARPVELGGALIPEAVQAVLSRFQREAGNPDITAVLSHSSGADEVQMARYAVNYLLSVLMSQTPEKIFNCPRCQQAVSSSQTESHLGRCYQPSAPCDHCGTTILQKNMARHLSYYCEENMVVCENCHESIVQKDLEDHQEDPEECPYERCRQCHLLLPRQCDSCSFHVKYCRSAICYGGTIMAWYQAHTDFPVYASRDRHTLVMILPGLSFINTNELETTKVYFMEYRPGSNIVISITVTNNQVESKVTIHGKVGNTCTDDLVERHDIKYECQGCTRDAKVLLSYTRESCFSHTFKAPLIGYSSLEAIWLSVVIRNEGCRKFYWGTQ